MHGWRIVAILCGVGGLLEVMAPPREGRISGKDIRWSTLVEDPQYFPYGVPCYAKYRALTPLLRRK